jgi:polysaccharide biosynthesis/export protein
MIARFVTVSTAVLLLIGCGASRGSVAFAQDQTPVPSAAPVGNAAGSSESAALPGAAGSSESAALPGASGAPATPASATPPAAPEPAAIVADPRTFRIGPEDVLDVYVRNDRELSRPSVPVRPDGKISLPLVNDVQAAGLTTDELRLQLMQEFKRFFENPEVSVGLREMHSFKVSVSGNVRMPGQYEVKSEQTVLDLITRAQGFNEFADKGSIRVLRRTNGKTQAIKFNYNDAKDGREGANFPVRPGDIVIVD